MKGKWFAYAFGAWAFAFAVTFASVAPVHAHGFCGDGVVNEDEGEQCDDGNLVSCDGCSDICRIEACGNGLAECSEECDDGNTDDGDGCNASCEYEYCGDGTTEPALGEECDDGNNDDCDGCTYYCTVEACGNFYLDCNEECDDGNTDDGDGCSAGCLYEPAVCGDGILQNDEECDDGNTDDGDGCSSTCIYEYCGDGIEQPGLGEQCDDGNFSCGDGCCACVSEGTCGDGVREGGEQCDDGNLDDGDGCSGTCRLEDLTAPDGASVLILAPTVTNGYNSVEAVQSVLLGLTPVVVDAAQWASMTGPQFASYRAIVLGDPTCVTDPGTVAAAVANAGVWGPRITGNVIINGTDPVFHSYLAGPVTLINQSINFAADADTTGAYVSLSCYYYNAPDTGAPVDVLAPFGTFTVRGQFSFGTGCPADAHIVALHPALAGLADADLSNWGCSVHEAFVEWDSDFNVLAIARDIPSSFVASDGTTGAPYIIARGEQVTPIACGDGVTAGDEECDDGNLVGGDGCSATCRIEACGNDRLDVGEECDDGNVFDGDGCSANCTLERCGDGVTQGDEDCDDGNNEDGDGCNSDCRDEYCGDGVLQSGLGEECDDGNNVGGDGCTANCAIEVPAYCGDGVVDTDEQCDDGNNVSEDGCSAECRLEFCGDGVLQPGLGEECDDGNTNDGDGCSEICTIEEPGDCGCLDLDQDGWVSYYGPCEGAAGVDKHNRWLPECESFNDCDDSDPTINPGRQEIPGDGIDQNCNGNMTCGVLGDGASASAGVLAMFAPALFLWIRRRVL